MKSPVLLKPWYTRSAFCSAVFLLYLADGDDEDREDEDSEGHPCHVGFEAPRLSEASPALIDTWSHF